MASIKTSQESLDAILERLYDYDIGEVEVRTDYSGRGMYNKECIGFVVDNSVYFLMALTAALIEMNNPVMYDEAFADAPEWSDLRTSQDSMGLSTIVYFPNWELDTDD